MEGEKREFFERVRAGYLARARQFERIVTINAGQPLAVVQAEVDLVINRFIQDSKVEADRNA